MLREFGNRIINVARKLKNRGFNDLIQKQNAKNAELHTKIMQLSTQVDSLITKNNVLQQSLEKASFQAVKTYEGFTNILQFFAKELKKQKIKSGTPSVIEWENALTFEEQLSNLKKLEPNAFEMWWNCFLNGEKEYRIRPEENLSWGHHDGAEEFNNFISPYLNGHILDIGCGPQLVPIYLKSAIQSDVQIFGVDPLYAEHPFEFYQGFAEFLPWKPDSFDLVICATSLDHCLSLTRTLEEIKRVLKKGGKFITWVGFIPGAKQYDPKSLLKPVDDFHLFHFDQPWFEAFLQNYFKLNHHMQSPIDNSNFYVFEN